MFGFAQFWIRVTSVLDAGVSASPRAMGPSDRPLSRSERFRLAAAIIQTFVCPNAPEPVRV
jgi:hypothetical protein